MQAQRAHRQEVIRYSHLLSERAWVANHDGNISMRVGTNRFLATPTATAKADVADKNLIILDEAGKRIAGTARPFSEFAMHAAVYGKRDDVHAVIHAHPPYATALACSGSTLIERPFMAEAIVSLGPLIPTLPFAAPGAESVAALETQVSQVDALLLANHGVFAWGATLELAFLRLELVEHLARIATLAQATGGVKALPEHCLRPLLAARAKAKLGSAAEKAESLLPRPVVACAPAPHSTVPTIQHTGRPTSDQLAVLIREELSKLL